MAEFKVLYEDNHLLAVKSLLTCLFRMISAMMMIYCVC